MCQQSETRPGLTEQQSGKSKYKSLGLPLGLEAPVMTLNGVIFLFFFFLSSKSKSESDLMSAAA